MVQPQGNTPGTAVRSAYNGQPNGSPQAAGAVPASGRASRRALKNWRLRSRLLLLVIIPTLTAIVLGGIRISSSIQSARSYQRVETLASLGQQITVLAQSLQDERDQTVFYIAQGTDGGRADALSTNSAVRSAAALELGVVRRAFSTTDQSASQVRAKAGQIGSSYPVQTQQEAATVVTALGELKDLRDASINTQLPAVVVVQKYTQVIDDVLALNDEIAQGASDATLAQSVRVLGLVSAMKEEASEQRGILAAALLQGNFGVGQLAALQAAQSAQQSNLAAFDNSATIDERLVWNQSVDQSFVYLANSEELQSISLANSAGSLTSDPTSPVDWFGAMSNTIEFQMGSVERGLVATITSRAAVLRKDAITSAVVVGAAVILVLVLALLFTTIVGRSMVRPLRRLRAGALEVAGMRLPEAVRRMNESDGQTDSEGVALSVEPIDVDSTDEIGEVARAFDQVHREALRLAANEAALRGNVNAMFVNLSRRSQSLVERQIRLIDQLEQGEQNSERLSSLFQMDHLATLMRRNSENLLVLAGHDVSRRWNQPVALVDVLRAAVSEIEQYERVTLNVQPGIAVRGQAVSDVVHLTAELVENATSFSPADTPVSIVGHMLSSGGVLLEIADQGVGMGAEEMAHANWRLDNPPVVDVAVSRRMGLFVVARLAARHSIRVRLRPAASGGLTALVWLPDEVVTHEAPGSSMVPDRFDSAVTSQGGAGGAGDGMWGQLERSATEQEVNAARAPRFAPLLADAGDSNLGPRRIPGAGPRPGAGRWAATATGPLPAFRTSPQPAPQSAPQREPEPFIASPQPVAEAEAFGTAPQPAVGTGPEPVQDRGPELAGRRGSEPGADFESYHGEVRGATSGQQPAASAEQFGTAGGAESGWGRQAGSAGFPGSAQGLSSDAPPAPVNGLAGASDNAPRYDWTSGSATGGVVVPPSASLGEANRLPIFEAVESDWFRRGRHAVSRPGREERLASSAGSVDSDSGVGSGGADSNGAVSRSADVGVPESASAESSGWTSAADEGWRAAEAASAPTSGGVTSAGLPKRVPKANLVPGTAAETPAAAPALTRSASATRDRFASFQRGIRQGRAAASGEDSAGGEDDSSR
jgi:signal transduction histidine kinase